MRFVCSWEFSPDQFVSCQFVSGQALVALVRVGAGERRETEFVRAEIGEMRHDFVIAHACEGGRRPLRGAILVDDHSSNALSEVRPREAVYRDPEFLIEGSLQ